MTYVFVNGACVPEEKAVVSVNDRGFRFGDGVFETIPVHTGMPYLWEYHMDRLAGGLRVIGISFDVTGLLQHSLALLDANRTAEGLLRIHISRGSGSQGYLPLSANPTCVIQTPERLAPPQEAVMLWLSAYKKISPHALPAGFKLAQGMNSTLARMEAAQNNCFDALQQHENGCIAETSSANIFWRKDNTIHTPSLASGALAGVTRRRILELSPYPVTEGLYTLDELMSADAVIITNSACGVIAVAGLSAARTSWESQALALELNRLRNNDIIKKTVQLRESLAQR